MNKSDSRNTSIKIAKKGSLQSLTEEQRIGSFKIVPADQLNVKNKRKIRLDRKLAEEARLKV